MAMTLILQTSIQLKQVSYKNMYPCAGVMKGDNFYRDQNSFCSVPVLVFASTEGFATYANGPACSRPKTQHGGEPVVIPDA